MIKHIRGSWFEFQHHSKAEGVYWNPACAAFTNNQWDAKIKEMAESGMEYIVLMAVALDFEAYYTTHIFPAAKIACIDPLEVILSAGDKYGVKFFVGADFFGDWTDVHQCITSPIIIERRFEGMKELASRYSAHKSFYGWYWPNEAYIHKYYSEAFINYVNSCSALAHKLTPDAKTLIAPYGTRVAVPDDRYIDQLMRMDVDIITYQDEIGVQKTGVDESAAFFEGLRKAHDKVPNVALWADVEIFDFEGRVYESALLPAKFSRIEKQLEAVSPFVDVILMYQYLGLMNKPGTIAFAGHPRSVELYIDYTNWLKSAQAVKHEWEG